MIIVRIWEGLGNQLFQYAYAKALALRTGQQVALDIRETGAVHNDGNRQKRSCGLQHFRVTLPICRDAKQGDYFLNWNKNIKNVLVHLSMKNVLPFKFFEEDVPDFKEQLMGIKGNWYLQGFFQNVKYFQEFENEIRQDLLPKKRIAIPNELREILKSKATVSVHIRRGDYCKIGNCLPKIYYENAVTYVKGHIENPFWIVFSDDICWTKNNMDFGNNCYYMTRELGFQDFEELLIMSKCKNHIISNSTFSWWGAWLDKCDAKLVVGPKWWFSGSGKYRGINIMPDEWIRI